MRKANLHIWGAMIVLASLTQCTTMKKATENGTEITQQNTKQLVGKLSGATHYSLNAPINLTFTVENLSNDSIRFTQYHTPFEGFMSKFLEVKDADGQEVPYIGAMAKRVMPPPASTYLSVAPKRRKSVDFDLLKAYKIEKPGKYTLQYIGGGISEITAGESITITVDDSVPNTISNTLIIMLSKDQSLKDFLAIAEEYGATITHRYESLNGLAIKIPTNKSVEEAIAYFKKQKGVLTVEQDQVSTIQ